MSLPVLVLTSHSVHAPTHLDEINWCWEINCVSCKEIKVWSVSMIEMTREGESVGIRGSIVYVYKQNERIVPTLFLVQSISGPWDEIERERVGACVIPKADSKFWTGDHSIRKSYIKGIQCSFRFWTYNILPPILSSSHISFMCSQSISTLIKLIEKSINIQQRPINIVRFVRTPRFVFKLRWFPICFQPRECACSRTCSSY